MPENPADAAPLEPGKSFDIVVVCTGNRFRSPLTEALIRRATGDLPVRVRSAGTLEVGPAAALEHAVEAARAIGIDLSEHRARSLTGDDLSAADLVLGFERNHVATAVIDSAAPRARTFTLPQLVSLLEELAVPEQPDAIARARVAIEMADAARAAAGTPFEMAELADPIGRPAREQDEIARELQVLTERLVALLCGRTAARAR
jgi:protein-tyrosine phosphatase